MSKTVAFIAQTRGSATTEDQQACLSPSDLQVHAGSKAFNDLEDVLALKGIQLEPGDRVKIHALSCIDIATHKLVRAVVNLLKSGITFEICAPSIVVEPHAGDIVQTILTELDSHYRRIHGIKTHPAAMARSGRKPFLDPDKLEEIRALLSEPGATQAKIAQSLGVARATLFNYLERHDRDRPGRRRTRKAARSQAATVIEENQDPGTAEDIPKG